MKDKISIIALINIINPLITLILGIITFICHNSYPHSYTSIAEMEKYKQNSLWFETLFNITTNYGLISILLLIFISFIFVIIYIFKTINAKNKKINILKIVQTIISNIINTFATIIILLLIIAFTYGMGI